MTVGTVLAVAPLTRRALPAWPLITLLAALQAVHHAAFTRLMDHMTTTQGAPATIGHPHAHGLAHHTGVTGGGALDTLHGSAPMLLTHTVATLLAAALLLGLDHAAARVLSWWHLIALAAAPPQPLARNRTTVPSATDPHLPAGRLLDPDRDRGPPVHLAVG
ncbi:hypothetical protein N869_06985 [Cellulomonas bogoriensis 69B4 = DSM 16987]|uniref:Uncharacterized protein n=2 Tax=Cellulomonas bogoriensis TaxID=301388 RepID=A0A0A0BQV2_9CELL|nr:hypothetical protein N869_06985 [Cellulomonas bogoriensis 69B4 = DSM 16987]